MDGMALRSGRGMAGWPAHAALACALLAPTGIALAQQPVPIQDSAKPQGEAQAGKDGAQRISLDRVVAIVNGELILESDIDEEMRFAAFQPLRGQRTFTRDQIVERLIDRALILQQAKLQPGTPITDAEVDAELTTMRKDIPDCIKYHCDTDAGWKKFVEDQGFTLSEIEERWRVRMEVLQFIEERFRMGIRISQQEIDDYYQKTLVPAYAKDKVSAPKEDTINDRIQEILLQQQVTKLLEDWLQSLRAQGSVTIMKPGEATP